MHRLITDLVSLGPVRQPLEVQVLMHTEIRKYVSKGRPGELFSLLIADSSGEIMATVFGKSLVNAWAMCTKGASIVLTGADVQTANERFYFSSNTLEVKMDLERGGGVAPCPEGVVGRPKFNFQKIADLPKVGSNGAMVDILGLIISKETAAPITTSQGSTIEKASLVLADTSSTSVSCTFWGESANQLAHWALGTTLAIKGARTNAFGGLSLVCSNALTVSQPDIPESSELQNWQSQQRDTELLPVATKCQRPEDELTLEVPASIKRIRIKRGASERVFHIDEDVNSSQFSATPRFSQQ